MQIFKNMKLNLTYRFIYQFENNSHHILLTKPKDFYNTCLKIKFTIYIFILIDLENYSRNF